MIFFKQIGRGGGGTKPHFFFFRKLRLVFKIKDFENSLIVLEPACEILKSLKNGNVVSQLAKICSLHTGVFSENLRHKNPF